MRCDSSQKLHRLFGCLRNAGKRWAVLNVIGCMAVSQALKPSTPLKEQRLL
uniref:Uncharacterized protein n=1 Tax=Anguilla anguilla TaxID=7936 RepID=A0A0E9S3M3_ANGAN